MKKILLIPLLLLSFFLISDKVNALSYNYDLRSGSYIQYSNTSIPSIIQHAFLGNFEFNYIRGTDGNRTFNNGRFNISLPNQNFSGTYHVAFTIFYSSVSEHYDPTVEFDDIPCSRVSISNFQLPLGTAANYDNVATYTCYGHVFDTNHYIDFEGNTLTAFGLSRIVDITGSESDLMQKLNDLEQAINNISIPSNSGVIDAINNQSSQQHSDSQAEQNAINNNTQAVDDLNDTISDSDVSGNGADDFFNNFQNNDHGLSSIITAPLSFIQNLASSSCSSIALTIPFVNKSFNLPCMSTIYSTNFGSLFSIYRTITFGIVAYYVCVRIFSLVKGFKDPQDDRIEVVDL